jgi:RNA polymerase sigma-70 factor (ECF subfamily)
MLQERWVRKPPASPVSTCTELGFTNRASRQAKHIASPRGPNYRTKPEPEQARFPKPQGCSLDRAIRLAQRGDAGAFEYIYRLHCRRVYSLCLRLARDPVEAEDLTQEAFLQLFRKIHTFRGESAFSSWLYRLTANVAFMSFRKKKLATDSLESPTETDDETRRAGHEIGVIDLRLSGLFDRINLEAAIEQLPEGYRAMFLLHDVQGYDHNTIAKMRGCSVGNSKSQLHKARKRLREELRDRDYGRE